MSGEKLKCNTKCYDGCYDIILIISSSSQQNQRANMEIMLAYTNRKMFAQNTHFHAFTKLLVNN